MPEILEYEYTANGKSYSTIEEAVADYIESVKPGVSLAKLDKILKAINLDVFENLVTGVTFLKSQVAPLASETIRKKGHSKPFLDSGLLWGSVKDQMLNEHHGIVFIGEERDEIAERLQTGWTAKDGSKVPARAFFGLSREVLDEVDRILLEDE